MLAFVLISFWFETETFRKMKLKPVQFISNSFWWAFPSRILPFHFGSKLQRNSDWMNCMRAYEWACVAAAVAVNLYSHLMRSREMINSIYIVDAEPMKYPKKCVSSTNEHYMLWNENNLYRLLKYILYVASSNKPMCFYTLCHYSHANRNKAKRSFSETEREKKKRKESCIYIEIHTSKEIKRRRTRELTVIIEGDLYNMKKFVASWKWKWKAVAYMTSVAVHTVRFGVCHSKLIHVYI